jgi:pimeloyl-ACP methyl ester carboxylesterase
MPLPPRLHGASVNAHLFYLHGFASSPASTKARFFERHLAAHGVALHCPDLNAPDFETLTVTRMVTQAERAILALPAAPTVLFGSSLGALVALVVASRWSKQCTKADPGLVAQYPIDRLVLLAPALDFARSQEQRLGDEGLAQWRSAGTMPVYHYGEGRTRNVHYGLHEDALGYDAFASYLAFPILVFHGRRDDLVDPGTVEAFARSRPNVILRMLDDDHQLVASLDEIWEETSRFLGLEGSR